MRNAPIPSDRPRLPTSDWVFFAALLLAPATIAGLILFPREPPARKYVLVASFDSPDRRFEFRLLCSGDDFVGYADGHRVEILDRQANDVVFAASVSILIDCCGDEGSEGPFTWENRRACFSGAQLREAGVE